MVRHMIFSYIARFGYLGIFGSMMLGMIGLPIPDEVLMAFAGYLVYTKQLVYWLTVLIAGLGAVSGVSFSYWVGRRFGVPLVEKYGKYVHLSMEKLDKTEVWFERFGKFAIAIGYFIPGVRHFTAYSAGMSRLPYRLFLLYAGPGGFFWAFSFVTMGRIVGKHWLRFSESFHKYMLQATLVALAAAGIWLFFRYRKKENEKAGAK